MKKSFISHSPGRTFSCSEYPGIHDWYFHPGYCTFHGVMAARKRSAVTGAY